MNCEVCKASFDWHPSREDDDRPIQDAVPSVLVAGWCSECAMRCTHGQSYVVSRTFCTLCLAEQVVERCSACGEVVFDSREHHASIACPSAIEPRGQFVTHEAGAVCATCRKPVDQVWHNGIRAGLRFYCAHGWKHRVA